MKRTFDLKFKSVWMIFLAFLLVNCFAVVVAFGYTNIPRKITVCFRCDDFFAVKNHPRRNIIKVKQSIIDIFKKNKIPLTIAVIPKVHNSISGHIVEYKALNENDLLTILLKPRVNDSNFEIAMHGLTHLPNVVSKDSEFIGLSLEEQIRKISQGKQILLNALGQFDLATFIPPWNSFDLNTIKTLQIYGFEYLSGDTGIIRKQPFAIRSHSAKEYFKIHMIPGTCSLKEFKSVFNLALKDSKDAIIVVILHAYDFQEYRSEGEVKAFFNLKDLAKLLEEIKSIDQINFSRIKDINPVRLSALRYTAACRYYLLLKIGKLIFPRKFLDYIGFTDAEVGHWLDKGMYLSERRYVSLYYRILFLFGLCSVCFAIIFGLLTNLFFKIIKKNLNRAIIHVTSWVIFCIILIYLEIKLQIVSSPNMFGILISYCIGFLSMYLAVLVVLRVRNFKT